MNTSIIERIRQLAAELFNLPVEHISSSSSSADIKAWDSLQHLNLILALEQEFQIQLGPEDAERMKTIYDVAKQVEYKLMARA
ncbi:MAG: acyl carrier protein [Acidobacteria bacterium]|nr:acyl carrier protein [Acidobacteriota bacterium]